MTLYAVTPISDEFNPPVGALPNVALGN